ncbi:cornifelin homolog B-like [Salarias fasciatus]|uniref:Cornifelin homolog B-like n=1 Tax=Salarias fasciatus TaxID=181472 RepID=A0A672GGN9_SALFA|nr:cornifelin homolog B-like [Salarias fasciatus]
MTSKMVVSQPAPVMHLQNSSNWGSGVCDCTENMRDCCCGFWCCPCFACKTSERYGEPLCLPLLEIFSGFIPAITMSLRVSMRARYGIHGDLCNDCLLSSFCTSCVWCQMSREIRRRKVNVVLVNSNYS